MNFIDRKTGTWNTSLRKLNKLNLALERSCRPVSEDIGIHTRNLYLSKTDINEKYGSDVIEDFMLRFGLEKDDNKIVLIRTTIMNPIFTENSTQNPN